MENMKRIYKACFRAEADDCENLGSKITLPTVNPGAASASLSGPWGVSVLLL